MRQMQRQEAEELCSRVENSLRKRFRLKLWCNFTKAIRQYELLSSRTTVSPCACPAEGLHAHGKAFSGAAALYEVSLLGGIPRYGPRLQPGELASVIEENARKLNIPIHIFESNIFDYVYNVDKSPCYLCARMRRGHLYDYARRLGCNKIALGHHYDDVIETILMGMLYGAQVQTMMPKLHSTNFPGMELIRPLYLIREDDIKAWRDANELHFIQCACHFTDTCTTCSNQETRSKRQEIKELIRTLKQRNPDVEAHIFRSVENVNLDTVIGWKTGGKKYSFLDRYDEEA